MTYAGKTDIGLHRKQNQDAFAVKKIHKSVLGVVCDGMGGMQCGDIASKLAIETFVDYMSDALKDNSTEDEIVSALTEATSAANSKVLDYSVRNNLYYGMGTTLVSFLKKEETLYVLNVGDSRCYALNGGELIRITKDHSYVQQLIDRGVLTEEAAEFHPEKSVITRSIGTESYVRPDIFIKEGFDALLLCSDGLTRCVKEEKIKEIIQNGNNDADRICADLIEAAKAGGGFDNITVVVLLK